MKKFVCVLLALAVICSLGMSAFAADDVTGTLADGSAITKPVSEVAKSVEEGLAELEAIDAERAEKLKTFFADAEANAAENEKLEIIKKGIVHFAGFFAEVTEDELDVDLPVPGAKAGQKYGVTLSNGTSELGESKEDDTVTAAFPKDADYIGYVITAEVEDTQDDGTTFYYYYDTTGNEITPSDSPVVNG